MLLIFRFHSLYYWFINLYLIADRNRIQSGSLTGNMQELNYYYTDIFVGDFDQTKRQSLIVDTGSSILAFPWDAYCDECGTHKNPHYPINDSRNSSILKCDEDHCLDCSKNKDCKFSQAYSEGSKYKGFFVADLLRLGQESNKEFTMIFGWVTHMLLTKFRLQLRQIIFIAN